ncbi:ATPase [Microbacteriaceae bacterium VKM Ac-2854]|nr:ATPase [Microbacteriaceae bacterium VKM Ac-2854]
MARADLSALLDTPEEPSPAAMSAAQAAPPRPENEPAAAAAAGYTAFARKEARLREDQVSDLTAQARRLNRAKANKGTERITENTLLRIGADWILAHAGELAGDTEQELRKSVGL